MRGVLAFLLLGFSVWAPAQSFLDEQLRYPRVRDARDEVDESLRQAFEEKELTYPPTDVFIRAFKSEQEMEVWVEENEGWALFKTYPICRLSGRLGPKRKEGDGQIPEGFYRLTTFNPASSFHLSMQVNYPNASDRKLSDPDQPGGLIFIHGACVTIGCIPITDPWIKELYWLAVLARSNGGGLPVHIFPFRMSDPQMAWARRFYGPNELLIQFWEQLQDGYEVFESTKQLPVITVDSEGRYSVQ